jgi:hypothetical protein
MNETENQMILANQEAIMEALLALPGMGLLGRGPLKRRLEIIRNRNRGAEAKAPFAQIQAALRGELNHFELNGETWVRERQAHS